MLCLSGDELRASLDCQELMSCIEQALAIQQGGDFQMPERLHLPCGEEGILLAMPCAAGAQFSCKLVSVFPGNRRLERPVIDGLLVLNDAATGEPLALMDAKVLTAVRTAAVSAVSVRHLARPDAHVLCMIGCGGQAFDQVRLCCAARPLDEVRLVSRSRASRAALAVRLRAALPGLLVVEEAPLREQLAGADIVIAATTSRTPVLPDEPALFPGKHWIAVGSFEPTVREYPDALFEAIDEVWVDTEHALRESGELSIPIAQGRLDPTRVRELGALLQSAPEAAPAARETTFFKSVGMALFDLVVAGAALRSARARGLGVELRL